MINMGLRLMSLLDSNLLAYVQCVGAELRVESFKLCYRELKPLADAEIVVAHLHNIDAKLLAGTGRCTRTGKKMRSLSRLCLLGGTSPQKQRTEVNEKCGASHMVIFAERLLNNPRSFIQFGKESIENLLQWPLLESDP